MDTKAQALTAIDMYAQEFTALSDQIWDCPELRFEEYKSAELLCQALERFGFSVQREVAGMKTAFTGTWGSGGPVIGVLGEFDALSGLSQKAGCMHQEPIEPGGNGHGCGHHLLGVGSLAAAVAVKNYLEETHTPGTVIYYGCPGEEGGSGKAFLARAGAFDQLDAAITWHPGDTNVTLVCSSLANYQILYRFYGRASHAAAQPERGRSALDAVELMNTGVQYLREHVIESARIHYAITNTGGTSPNVVQPYSEVLYLIRAPKMNQVEDIYQRIGRIAQGAALMTDTRVEEEFIKACADIVPNRVLAQVLQENMQAQNFPVDEQDEAEAKEIIATFADGVGSMAQYEESYFYPEKKEQLSRFENMCIRSGVLPLADFETCMSGSSDVGDCSWNTPTAQVFVTAMAAGTPGHSWQLVSQGKSALAHKGMLYAGKVMAGAIIDLLQSPELITQAKEELQKRLKGNSYHSAIPDYVEPKPFEAT